MANDVVKRGRGRPRKYPVEETKSDEPKKKRGRPKKIHTLNDGDAKRMELENLPPVETKYGKLLGYCPKCHNFISTLDIQKNKQYFCYSCQSEITESKLLKEKPIKKDKEELKPKTKKEYLEDILSVHDDAHIISPAYVDPNTLIDLSLKTNVADPPIDILEENIE